MRSTFPGVIAALSFLVGCVNPDAPLHPEDPSDFVFEVPKGSTGNKLAPRLVEAGLVSGEWQWKWFLRQEGGQCIKAGRFRLKHSMTPREVRDALCGPPMPEDVPFTVVEGWRIRDIDAALLDYIAAKEGLTLPQVEALLNNQSGLLGISGLTNDMRDLLAEAHEHQDRRATLAIEIFCYRARKYVGAYLAALGGADAIVFAGGVGENSPEIRRRICDGLQWAGLHVDAAANDTLVGGKEGRFSTSASSLAAWVVPTDEELLIARDTFRVIAGVEPP